LKISREIKTAVLAIAAIALFVFGFNFLKGKDLLDSSTKVLTKFDNSYGLVPAATVSFDGIQVGKVLSVINDFENGGVVVEFSIAKDIPFTKNSSVKLIKDILGGISLALVPSNNGARIQNGDVVSNEVGVGLVDKLQTSLTGISSDLTSTLKKADSLFLSVNSVVTDDTDKGLKAAIAELTQTMRAFKSTSYELNKMISEDRSNFNEMIISFKLTADKFGKVADSLKQVNLNKTVTSLDITLNKLNVVLSKLENGEGTMGKLLQDDTLYTNLSGSTAELEALLRDIKLHPKRYFRVLSKKEIPYKNEEDKN
jgi:phospholipid/cholesterol/gamma-HCH transport system substrate-binding protein